PPATWPSPTPPARPIKLRLTCYVRQLTAKKWVGEYRPGLPGREHGRAYLRNRPRARLASGHAGRRSKLRRQLRPASLRLSHRWLGRLHFPATYLTGTLRNHSISSHGALFGRARSDAAHGSPAHEGCDQQYVAGPVHVRWQRTAR